ncbi:MULTISPECIES: amino acid ABC transporter permease [unclassified Chelatococcus]|uniref:amino acid ABC transporter permease n=1 Tax=unclassified Chelatococcus TaxID=2638111 RepID=UPI001BD19279|nr:MULTISPECIES: amino acid ABC transporter permease [unclassified Chelatococcus]MBS7701603.1 amino acid ABC transporter permease [Chelatococcus sp. YT9]MBX3559718.1 amino acid ABC transporter permease [Chelatococcus sp.]
MKYDWSVVWEYRWELLGGVYVTFIIALLTMAIAIPLGIAVMMLRQSGNAVLRWCGGFFVEFFRNIPLILLVVWVFYAIPIFFGVRMGNFATSVTALVLGIAAYNAENFRAGVNSVRRGQSEAGLALGMSQWQVTRVVVLPQAIRRVVPVLASTWVSLFKATSLVSVINVVELSYVGTAIRGETFRVLEILTAVAVIYWLLGYPQAKLADFLNRKYGVVE